MSRVYVKSNPRTVRSAGRRGWTVVNLPRAAVAKHDVSYLGLLIWAERNSKGHYVSSMVPTTRFVFENPADASWFLMKWCL